MNTHLIMAIFVVGEILAVVGLFLLIEPRYSRVSIALMIAGLIVAAVAACISEF